MVIYYKCGKKLSGEYEVSLVEYLKKKRFYSYICIIYFFCNFFIPIFSRLS